MSGQLESLRRFLVAREPVDADIPPHAPIAVGSGKGGIGVSTVAALLALAVAERGRQVLLVDADHGFGRLHALFGIGAGAGLAALRGGGATPRDLMVAVAPGLSLLTVSSGSDPAELSGTERKLLYRRLGEVYPEFDVVVVDVGSRLDGILSACAVPPRMFLLVASTDSFDLAATHALFKVLRKRLPHVPAHVAFNRCAGAAAEAAYQWMSIALTRFLDGRIEFAGCIPDDDEFRAALAAGTPLRQVDARLGAGAAIREVAAHLLAAHSPAAHMADRRHTL